jgi:hypothetical protein
MATDLQRMPRTSPHSVREKYRLETGVKLMDLRGFTGFSDDAA